MAQNFSIFTWFAILPSIRNNRLITASRPYKKKDNTHAEQKNLTELFGYDRLDNTALVPLMNEVHSTLWCPLQNHFCSCLKL